MCADAHPRSVDRATAVGAASWPPGDSIAVIGRIGVGPCRLPREKRGHAVRYPSCDDSSMARFYNKLLDDGHVDSKLLGKVLDSCPTLYDKMNFMSALLLQPPTDQQREWTEAFGLAWRWTDILYNSEFKVEVIRSGHEAQLTDCDERMIK